MFGVPSSIVEISLQFLSKKSKGEAYEALKQLVTTINRTEMLFYHMLVSI